MNKPILKCPNCGNTQSHLNNDLDSPTRFHVYSCSSPECGKKCCERCNPGVLTDSSCGCSWEYMFGDSDDGTETKYGYFEIVDKICTQVEWNNYHDDIKLQSRMREEQSKMEDERRRRYEAILKKDGPWFKALMVDGEIYTGKIVGSDFTVRENNTRTFSVSDFPLITSIDLSKSCRCFDECAKEYGRGYLYIMRDRGGSSREVIDLHPWSEKKHFWSERKFYSNYWGSITIRLFGTEKHVQINVGDLISLDLHVPPMSDIKLDE